VSGARKAYAASASRRFLVIPAFGNARTRALGSDGGAVVVTIS